MGDLKHGILKFPTYEVIEAKTKEEAVERSSFSIGKAARVSKIRAIPAGRIKGAFRWTVFAGFELEKDHDSKTTTD